MKIEVMSRSGHDLLAEVTRDSTAAELAFAGNRFSEFKAKGYLAFTRKGVRLDRFSPEIDDDVVFIAPLVGG
ncbi:MAG: hypothetical protein OEN50_14450 [Deltaproteobacteria bacterium]|nr:hypothetical protein [Deltaproteobacteria bacterium]